MTGKNKNGSWAFQYLINLKGAMNSSRLINKKKRKKENNENTTQPGLHGLELHSPGRFDRQSENGGRGHKSPLLDTRRAQAVPPYANDERLSVRR